MENPPDSTALALIIFEVTPAYFISITSDKKKRPLQLMSTLESLLLFLSVPSEGQNIPWPLIGQGKKPYFISLFTP